MSNILSNGEATALHHIVFKNDISGVSKYLHQHGKAIDFTLLKDQHGNTPLHIAVILGHKECVQILLKNSHPVTVKNLYGWTPLQEAVSYGDRQTIKSLFRAIRKQNKIDMRKRKPDIQRALQSLGGDFSMVMKWDFQSWIPFVTKILPSDVCHIYRSGSQIRLDSTLEDFNDMHWVRGDLTFLVNFATEGEPSMILMDNRRKVYQHMQQTSQQHEASLEDEVDIAMSSDIIDVAMKTKESIIERMNSGWFFRREKNEKIGKFNAKFYRISGLNLQTRKRREHLTDEDIRKNKSLREAISRGDDSNKVLEDSTEEAERRKSLIPPDKPLLSWEEYISSSFGPNPNLGRSHREKTNQKQFDPVLGMSSEFPVRLENLLPIFEALGPKAKLLSKFRDFVTLRLPPGFPVRIDLPIFPTVKATVTFPQFDFIESLPESLFIVPSSYKEDPDWFEKSTKEKQQELSNNKL